MIREKLSPVTTDRHDGERPLAHDVLGVVFRHKGKILTVFSGTLLTLLAVWPRAYESEAAEEPSWVEEVLHRAGAALVDGLRFAKLSNPVSERERVIRYTSWSSYYRYFVHRLYVS